MKRFWILIALFALGALLISDGCASGRKHRAGPQQPPGATNASPTAAHPGGANIGTNLSSEQAVNAQIAHAATNSHDKTDFENVGGPGNSPGGVMFGAGTGTGSHGPLFWFYVILGIAFVIWLGLAIGHRVRSARDGKDHQVVRGSS